MSSAKFNTTTVGWVSAGGDRGTIDIMWASAVVIVLCTWVSTYPNIPPPKAKWHHEFLDKAWLAFIGLSCPEFLFAIAIGQLSEARRSVDLFRSSREINRRMKWTLTHGFFVGMGGIYLSSPDYPDGFPINAEQLFYLLKNEHIEFFDMESMEISERNTQDRLARIITSWQVIWFFVIEMIRVGSGLPMTTLELTALAFAYVMIGTSICWFYKPSIRSVRYIATKNHITVQAIREHAKHTTHTQLSDKWYRTPLDFISRRPYVPDTHRAWYVTLCELINFPGLARPILTTPWDRFPSDAWAPIVLDVATLAFGITIWIGFSICMLFSWNFHFPTPVERKIWRAAAVYVSTYSIVWGMWYVLEAMWWNRDRKNETADNRGRTLSRINRAPTDFNSRATSCDMDAEAQKSKGPGQRRVKVPERVVRFMDWLHSLRNISRDHDPSAEISLRVNIPLLLATVVYMSCRLFLYIEDFIALRSQPAGIYTTVSTYLPFLG